MEAWAAAGAQYVTPDSIVYCEKVKMCQYSSAKLVFLTKFVHLPMAGKRGNAVVQLKKKYNILDLIAAQYF
jgi:hypothetical protein